MGTKHASRILALAFLALSSRAFATPETNVMPGDALFPRQYRPGPLVVWGNANHGDGSAVGFDYCFTFDANPDISIADDGNLCGVVANDRFIPENITLTLLNSKTRALLVGHLTVTDPGDLSSNTDTFILDIVDPADPINGLQVEVNIAINHGLRSLYLMQNPDGSWTYYEFAPVGTTGFAVWAFENHNHFDKNDHNGDIYADTVTKGLEYLLCADAISFAPPAQSPCGNPDSDLNGICIQLSVNGVTGYSCGIANAALVAAQDPARPIGCGPGAGTSLKQVIQDCCDWSFYAQADDFFGNPYRGGWRYGGTPPGVRLCSKRDDHEQVDPR